MGIAEGSSHTQRFNALARLVRLPNLFTAPPDVLLGAAIVAALGISVDLRILAFLVLTSMLAYAGGTTLNDVFDAEEDEHHRPDRPIPEGAISLAGAFFLGVGSLLVAVLIATLVGGLVSGLVAGLLAVAIIGYDGVTKGRPIGFVNMGICRGLNVVLGTTVAISPLSIPWWGFGVIIAIIVYIAGITYLAEFETGGDASVALAIAIGAWGVAISWGILLVGVGTTSRWGLLAGSITLFAFALWTGPSLWRLRTDPRPGDIGRTIGQSILGLILLNAAMAAIAGVGWTIGIAVWMIPSIALATVFDVS